MVKANSLANTDVQTSVLTMVRVETVIIISN